MSKQRYGGRSFDQPPVPLGQSPQTVSPTDPRLRGAQQRVRATGLLYNKEQTAAIRLGGAAVPASATTYLDLSPTQTTPVIERSTSGLIAADSFNRTAGSEVGGGWTEDPDADWTLYNDAGRAVCQHEDDDGDHAQERINQDFGSVPTDIIAEFVFDTCLLGAWESTQLGIGYDADPSGSPSERLIAVLYPNSDNVKLYRETGGAGAGELASQAFDFTQQRKYGVRLIAEQDGENYDYRIYVTERTGWDDTTTDHGSALLTVDDDATPPDFGTWATISAMDQRRFANFFICGRNITINNVPSGYYCQVDGRTPVHETAGTVSFDVDAWNLPATQIKLLDQSLQQRATLSPSGGVYGGDVYTVTSASYLMYHDDGAGNPAFALYADGAVLSTGTFVGGVIQDTAPPNAQIVMSGTPAVADYIDLSATGSDVLMQFGDLSILKSGTIKIDSISESTSGSGVTIDGLNIKDGAINEDLLPTTTNAYDLGSSTLYWKNLFLDGYVYTDAIQEKTAASGVTCHSTFKVNVIDEHTADAGVTIEGITFKDAGVNEHLLPTTTNVSDLGSTSLYWRHGYFDGTVYTDTIAEKTASNGVRIASNLLPGTTGTYDLGSGSLAWRDAYFSGTVAVSGVMRIPTAAPGSPANGDIWTTGGKLYYREGGATYELQGV